MEHTPGPWKIANSGYANAPSVVFVGDKRPDFGARYPLQGCDWIAEVREDESPRGREFHANTRLIAAAPDLLEALEGMLVSFAGQDETLCMECGEGIGTGKTCDTCYVIGKAITAIARAKGKP